jgi:hypothetical protein
MTTDQDTRDELLPWLDARSKALVEGDAAHFEEILADDFRYTNASGKVFDKAAYIELFLRSKQLLWQSQDLHDLDLRRHGDVVVMTCRIRDRASYRGEPFEGHFRSTQVLVRQPDGWKYVAGQSTEITEGEA